MRPARGWARGRSYSDPRIETAQNMRHNPQYAPKGPPKQEPQYGKSNRPNYQDYPDEYSAFETIEDRSNFIYRVYLILSFAIGFCALVVFLTSYYDESREFLNDYWWLYIVFMVAFMIIYLIFVCVESARKSFPINLVLFILMVIFLAAATAIFSSLYSLMVIAYAFITTASITILITIIARFIPIDFTKCGTLLCILSLVFLLISIVVTILILVLNMPILHVGLAGLGVLLITFFMLFDTQRILGGRYELEEDEYLLGAIQLLVDIIYMYQYLLILFGFCASDE